MTNDALNFYRERANEIRDDISSTKLDSTLNNRQKREIIREKKSEISSLFSEAGKDLNREEFREFRSFFNEGDNIE